MDHAYRERVILTALFGDFAGLGTLATELRANFPYVGTAGEGKLTPCISHAGSDRQLNVTDPGVRNRAVRKELVVFGWAVRGFLAEPGWLGLAIIQRAAARLQRFGIPAMKRGSTAPARNGAEEG